MSTVEAVSHVIDNLVFSRICRRGGGYTLARDSGCASRGVIALGVHAGGHRSRADAKEDHRGEREIARRYSSRRVCSDGAPRCRSARRRPSGSPTSSRTSCSDVLLAVATMSPIEPSTCPTCSRSCSSPHQIRSRGGCRRRGTHSSIRRPPLPPVVNENFTTSGLG